MSIQQPTTQLRVALAQIDPIVGDLVGNADLVIEQANRAVAEGAQIVLFPELVLAGYPPEDLVLRADFIAGAQEQMLRIAQACPQGLIVVGCPLADEHGLNNALVVINDRSIVTNYSKQLLPNYGVFDEERYFAVGRGNVTVELDGVTVGLSICEDLWHDEPVISDLAQSGAQLILNASASPFHEGKATKREQMLQARAAKYGVAIAYCNLFGGQDELVFDGGSVVIDRAGEIIARAPQFEPALLHCALSLSPNVPPGAGSISLPPASASARGASESTKSAPAVNSITGLLEPRESEIYHALMCGVRDYVNKNGFGGAILGVSGGIDSALVLTLACDALGAERVTGASMPSPYNSDATKDDAVEIMDRLGCRSLVLPIAGAMKAFDQLLEEPFEGLAEDSTEENLQARIRGMTLMAISNKLGPIVLTTGNKSEAAVGYATLYGDMAGGFAVLKDVPKTLVFSLSRWRNANLPHSTAANEPIPPATIDRPPSAELKPGQTDEQALGSYAVLDDLIERYVERDQSLDEIVASGVDHGFAERMIKLIDRSEYKRRQAPPGVKITLRAFGRDRRMPITARRRFD